MNKFMQQGKVLMVALGMRLVKFVGAAVIFVVFVVLIEIVRHFGSSIFGN